MRRKESNQTKKMCLMLDTGSCISTHFNILIPAVAPRNTGVVLCLSDGILFWASFRHTSNGADKFDGCSAYVVRLPPALIAQ